VAAGVNAKLTPRHFLYFSIDSSHIRYVAVGDGVIKGGYGARAGDIFDINDFLFSFDKVYGLKRRISSSQVPVFPGLSSKREAVSSSKFFPPQAKEQQSGFEHWP
jgi:hypothetical protein